MANSNLKRDLSMECKPKLLKDFLNDDSRNDFGSYPRKPCRQMVQNQQLIVLKRSKSRTASSTILAIHKASEIVIKTLKYFPFASLKSPSILPRSISRKFSSGSRRKYEDENQMEVTEAKVKVKDILRWRSSRDLDEEESTPLDLFYSTITTSGSTSCSSPLTSKSSSWCESDFSAEDFPSWCYASGDCFAANEIKMANNKKKFSPRKNAGGKGFLEKTMDEADEQYTPVSVLLSPFQEDEEKQGDEAEEKAKKLLHHLKETIFPNGYDSSMEDNLLMDFFWEELITDQKDEFLERKLIASSQDWLRGVNEGWYEWKMENKRENYVKEMEKGVRWNSHDEEKEEMSLQLEKVVLNSLVDEVLFDLVTL